MGTCNLASVILNFAESPLLDKKQSSTQFIWRWILQLFSGIFSDLKKLLNYFDGTAIFVFFAELFALLTAFSVFLTRAALYLDDWELSLVKLALLFWTSSPLNHHKLPYVSE